MSMFGRKRSTSDTSNVSAATSSPRRNSIKSIFGRKTSELKTSSDELTKGAASDPLTVSTSNTLVRAMSSSATASSALSPTSPFGAAGSEKDLLKGMTPLIKTVYQSDEKKFSELMTKKKSDFSLTDKTHKRNVIHWVATNGKLSQCQMLLNALTLRDPAQAKELINAVDNNGQTPACLVCLK